MLEWLSKEKIKASISVKFSQFGITPRELLRNDKPENADLLADLLKRAKELKTRIWIDAEHFDTRRHYNWALPILWQKGFKNIGRVIQSSADDPDWKGFIKKLALCPIPTRICRGAYRNDSGSLSFEKDLENPEYLLLPFQQKSKGLEAY